MYLVIAKKIGTSDHKIMGIFGPYATKKAANADRYKKAKEFIGPTVRPTDLATRVKPDAIAERLGQVVQAAQRDDLDDRSLQFLQEMGDKLWTTRRTLGMSPRQLKYLDNLASGKTKADAYAERMERYYDADRSESRRALADDLENLLRELPKSRIRDIDFINDMIDRLGGGYALTSGQVRYVNGLSKRYLGDHTLVPVRHNPDE
jgi:hypothetical protein